MMYMMLSSATIVRKHSKWQENSCSLCFLRSKLIFETRTSEQGSSGRAGSLAWGMGCLQMQHRWVRDIAASISSSVRAVYSSRLSPPTPDSLAESRITRTLSPTSYSVDLAVPDVG